MRVLLLVPPIPSGGRISGFQLVVFFPYNFS